MSRDGTTLLFGTAANNFYAPAFGKPPYLPFATGPVPKNFLLGGTGGGDIQGRFRTEDVAPLTSHVYADVITGSGPGIRSTVTVYSGQRLSSGGTATQAQFASYPVSAIPGRPVGTNGVYVAAADMNGDGKAEVVVTFDKSPTAAILHGLSGSVISSRNLGAGFATGATVAARAGRIMVGSAAGAAATVRVFGYQNLVWTVDVVQPPLLPGIASSNKFGLYVG